MLVRNNLDQDTQEWLDWRRNGTGGSDVRPIRGKSKYKSVWRVWAEKKGLVAEADLSRNPNVRRGKRLEPLVREVIEDKLGVKLDVYCAHDAEHPWRLISFDGVTPSNIPVEIKCPSTQLTGNESQEELDALLNDRYLDLVNNGRDSALFMEYEDQMMYQIGLLEAPYGYLVFYFEHNNEMKIFKVNRSEELITQIFNDVDNFCLEHLEKGVAPEKDAELDYYEPSEKELLKWDVQTMEFLEATAEERELNKKLKAVKVRKDAATLELKEMAGEFKMLTLHGLKITFVKGRETFQYNEYLASNDIKISDSEKKAFTKIGKTSVRVSVNRDVEQLEQVSNKVIQHQRDQAMELLAVMSEEDREELHARSDNNDIEDDYFYD
ncbi:lambda-exonuclease family protein [Enterovibrio norvegicus]|uniref:lambda-exonuclease family protein n=1 Tax=Enterovibrio norvegicus TaxID=188144 RepID=UPI000C840102|nr:YqaJ viral recombinase family protein [Enterovibrio norvegicus]PMH64451.1 hypothetical protein BCU62_15465 [Enterovibrio norvegicus]